MTVSVLLSKPKYLYNVGATRRAVSCFGGGNLFFTEDRVQLETAQRIPREMRMKDYDNTPWKQLLHADAVRPVDHIQRVSDESLIPVAVELVPGAEPLHTFEHPKNALYIFGPEDGSLDVGLKKMCHKFVIIPSERCLNVSSAVYIVLYDRFVKEQNEN